MRGRVRRGIGWHVVEVGGAVSAYDAVGHGLAPGDGRFIFKVEKDIWFGGGVQGFRVPRCDEFSEQTVAQWTRETLPIFDRRPNSSALRLRNPGCLAARQRAVGIILT